MPHRRRPETSHLPRREPAPLLSSTPNPFADGSDLSAACLRVAYTVLLSAAAVLAVGHDLRHLPPMLSGVVLWLVFLGLVSSGSRPQPLRIQNGDLHVAPQRPPVQTTAWKRG